MNPRKSWKVTLVTYLLTAVVVAVGIWLCSGFMSDAQTLTPAAQMTSSNGSVALSLYRHKDDTFRLIHTAGPDWARSECYISGVTEFLEGSFSPDDRHCVLAFMGEDGKEWYNWTDYETSLSGSLPVESFCRSDDAFAKSLREEEGIWKDMRLRFLGWHGSKNWILFGYTVTAVDGTEHSGHFWFDAEARYEKDPVYIHEILD